MTARIRRFLAAAVVLVVVAAMASGCYVFGNGLTDATWQVTGVWDKVPGIQTTLPAEDIGRYTIAFAKDGTASIKADCNTVTATYATSPGRSLTIEPGASTMAMCPEGSLDTKFLGLLTATTSYSIIGVKLTMYIGNEGTMEFVAAQ
jgi:heat shock protein HslJ